MRRAAPGGELAGDLYRSMVRRSMGDDPMVELELTSVRARAYRAALEVTKHVHALSAVVITIGGRSEIRVQVRIGWRAFWWGRRMRVWSRVWAEVCDAIADQHIASAAELPERVVVEVCR